jgi:hypothetical protein
MKRLLLLLFAGLVLGVQAFAHEVFTLVSSETKTVTWNKITAAEKDRTNGMVKGSTLTFTADDIRLVVLTGPEDDMLSYRIQGIRNPTIVVPTGARLRILFVNIDEDMRHDIRFGHILGEFGPGPDTKGTAGADKLPAKSEDGAMNAQEMVLRANENGMYKYFCSVGSHAKGGMWGNIAVGVKPGSDIKTPDKTKHVHSPDEDNKENMPGMEKDHKRPEAKPGDMSNMSGMAHTGHDMAEMKMSSVSNIGDPMERESSGTSWAPDSSPMYAKVKLNEDGSMWMFMGTAFLRYTRIGSSRDVSASGKGGKSRVDAPSMFMAMYSHPIGEKAQVGFRGMMSLDPVIQRGYGYPLLYQSGELFRGEPLHDRQHPHDLISELAVTYSYKFGDKRSFYLYAGMPGEPALGPPMYLHRTSGTNNPDAPIGHHWQDATHISFGVVTAGFSFGKAKIEASAFNGTEPDENRWNFDRPRLNSFSGRFSLNPTKNWALQISHGYLKNPERSEPDVHVQRKTTASAIYNKQFSDTRNWANSFVWGQNYANGERTNSFLVESNFDLNKNGFFGRFETVQKSGHELVLDAALEHDIFHVQEFSAGYVRDIVQEKGIDVGLGAMGTLGHNPASLKDFYGGTTHGGWQVFMRFRTSRHGH